MAIWTIFNMSHGAPKKRNDEIIRKKERKEEANAKE
jgi:hypothetical protein